MTGNRFGKKVRVWGLRFVFFWLPGRNACLMRPSGGQSVWVSCLVSVMVMTALCSISFPHGLAWRCVVDKTKSKGRRVMHSSRAIRIGCFMLFFPLPMKALRRRKTGNRSPI